eukprot:scaffold803_cov310-Pinguiococcus_pyrenoidosus.AAC.189
MDQRLSSLTMYALKDEGWEDAAALHRDARGTPPDKSSDTAEEKSVHRERRSAAKGERTSRPSSESRPRSSSSRGGRRKGDSAAEASEKPPKTPSKPPSEKFEMRKSAASAAREAPLGPPAQESSKKQKGDRAASKARPNYEENAEKLADERSADDSGEPSKTAQGSKAGNKYSEHKKKHFRHATELPRSSYADPVKPSERVQRPSGRAHARHASEMPSREPVLSVDDHYVARTHLEGAEARRDPIPGRLRLHGLVGERLEHMMELQYRKSKSWESGFRSAPTRDLPLGRPSRCDRRARRGSPAYARSPQFRRSPADHLGGHARQEGHHDSVGGLPSSIRHPLRNGEREQRRHGAPLVPPQGRVVLGEHPNRRKRLHSAQQG